jgi:hypothetical protein
MPDDTEADDPEYDQMLALEDLESLAEEMDEVGVTDRDQARGWLRPPGGPAQAGVPSAADEAALRAILDMMEELGVTDRAQLDARIRALRDQMDWT